jgi:8-oxo-dGTP pyrophosphatase MutT (NUDIX family)
MTGSSSDSPSGIPRFDPRHAPVEPSAVSGQPIALERLTPHALRQRFAHPPSWQPEFDGDGPRMFADEPRDAAVLVPIVDQVSGPTVLLTKRATHLSHHAGQVAFPGGRVDADDRSVVETALREAWEEVGLATRHVDVIGQPPEYVTGTGFRVTPVVALVRPGVRLTLQMQEVAEAFEVPLAFLMDPRHHRRHLLQVDHGKRSFYSIPWRPESGREFFIWGATAAILRNLYRFVEA